MYYLISVDVSKCNGCRICEMVCSLFNEKECNPEKSRIRAIKTEEKGILYPIPVLCQQCEDALCKVLCPVGAIYVDLETNVKLVDEEKCIGCRRCVYVCPFGAIDVDPVRQVALKCDLCGGDPMCVKFCPTGALQYIKADELGVARKREKVQDYLEYQRVVEALPTEEV